MLDMFMFFPPTATVREFLQSQSGMERRPGVPELFAKLCFPSPLEIS
jgi:hypothetical protein